MVDLVDNNLHNGDYFTILVQYLLLVIKQTLGWHIT